MPDAVVGSPVEPDSRKAGFGQRRGRQCRTRRPRRRRWRRRAADALRTRARRLEGRACRSQACRRPTSIGTRSQSARCELCSWYATRGVAECAVRDACRVERVEARGGVIVGAPARRGMRPRSRRSTASYRVIVERRSAVSGVELVGAALALLAVADLAPRVRAVVPARVGAPDAREFVGGRRGASRYRSPTAANAWRKAPRVSTRVSSTSKRTARMSSRAHESHSVARSRLSRSTEWSWPKDVHRLEQRRRHQPARDRHAQRAKREARLDAHLVHEHRGERGLLGLGREVRRAPRARRSPRREPPPRCPAAWRAASGSTTSAASATKRKPSMPGASPSSVMRVWTKGAASASVASSCGVRSRTSVPDEARGVQVGNQARGEVAEGQHAHVLGVDRLGLLEVKARGVGVDVRDVERGDEFA